jgi:hypothetical protein
VTFSHCKRDAQVYRLLLQSIQRIERVVDPRSPSTVLHVIVDRNVHRRRYLVSLVLNVNGRAILSEKEHHDSSGAALAAFEELERAIFCGRQWLAPRGRRRPNLQPILSEARLNSR